MARRFTTVACATGMLVATLPGAVMAAGNSNTTPSCPAVAHHVDASRDGFSCTSLPSVLHRKWSVTLNGPTSYPVIADGKVFVTTSSQGGSYGGWLYALSATSGGVVWGPVPLSGTYYYFPLAFGNGRVFVNDFDGTVRAFDARTGAQVWAQNTAYFSGEPVATDGTVWVASQAVYGLSETTGHIVAESAGIDGTGPDPAVDASGVYLSTGCQSQYKISLTGSIVWVDNNGCSGGGGDSTALWRSRMYGSDGDVVLAKKTGRELATFSGTPAFMGTVGYFGVSSSVFAEDVSTGVPLWTRTLSATVTAGPVATSAAIFVATAADDLVALNPNSGNVLYSLSLPGQPGGGGEYFSNPSDLAVGDSLVVVPTGSIVSAFG